jgi:hypothetical protein
MPGSASLDNATIKPPNFTPALTTALAIAWAPDQYSTNVPAAPLR